MCCVLFFFKQKTAYEMRISDWSSDVCSSDLPGRAEVAQCDTRHLELAVDTAGTTGQLTAVPDADPRTVPRHLRQGDGRQEPFFDRNRLVGDRKSVVSGKGVSVRVDLGGSRIITKKKPKNQPST